MTRFIILSVCSLFLIVGSSPASAGNLYDRGISEYKLNAPHTQILFAVDHLGFSHSYGKFLGYDGHLRLDYDHPEQASVEVVIHTTSVEMGDKAWNNKVKEIFKTDQYPDMTFKSTAVKRTGEKSADVTGDLTLLGVTKPVTLHVTMNKVGRDPFGNYVSGFSA